MSDPVFLPPAEACQILTDLTDGHPVRTGYFQVESRTLADPAEVLRHLRDFAASPEAEGWVCCAHRKDLFWIEEHDDLNRVRWPEAAELFDDTRSLHVRYQNGEWLLTEYTEVEGPGILLHKTFLLTGSADLLGYDVACEPLPEPADPGRLTWRPVACRYTGRETQMDGGE